MGEPNKVGFAVYRNKGFHVTFENGWTVSVQFGPGNYCENRDKDFDMPNVEKYWHSPDAEFAAWDKDGKWFDFEDGDTVQGWGTPAQVLEFMTMIAAKPA